MLGISDFWVWSAYLLCILSTIVCIGYGIMNWNKEADHENLDILEEEEWEAHQVDA